MVSPLDTRQLLEESVPIAIVLAFWVVLSWFGGSRIGTNIRNAGIVMALFYTVVRGIALSRSIPSTPQPVDPEELIRENAAVALPAAAWFFAAIVISFIAQFWDEFIGIGLFTSPENSFAFVLSTTGVLTVLLYAIAVGRSRIRDDEAVPER